jgi:trehalose 6-phosphate phosphatase
MNAATAPQLAELIAPLREDPASSAVLSDVDGTLSPIVRDPSAAEVPEPARELLRELAGRYALVGCLSGRPAREARRLVGLDELVYAGNHGFELLGPGESEPVLDPAVRGREGRAREFAESLDPGLLDSVGVRREDKGPIQAFHWRGAQGEAAARMRAQEIAALAQARDLVPRWGRKVLEVRPVAGIDKGSAIMRLLRERSLRNALYGGDDVTDLDAFRALGWMRSSGRLQAAVCVGIASDEGPSDIAERADVIVTGPDQYLDVLRALL